ncbi:response regulator [Clostridium sp.]|uniref:response regulator n=1 Tax=Clostridium sp. TaxID=1506 RepID=UPI00290C17A3|nr:response regulator [Clostridium sp.]MDU7215119.1 response regulator [Clostridium sp.]
MKNVLFLLNNLQEYIHIICELMDSNINVNIISDYNTQIISALPKDFYEIIIVEDINQKNFSLNCAKLLKRTSKESDIILISDNKEAYLDTEILKIISKKFFLERYRKILESCKVKWIQNVDNPRVEINKIIEEHKNIIIVDDDSISLAILDNILTIEGYNVEPFDSANDAIRHLTFIENSEKKVDLFILDLIMPNIDGFRLLKRIREYNNFRNVPILIVSSISDKRVVAQAAKYGVRGYILKPFNRIDIKNKIKSVLN